LSGDFFALKATQQLTRLTLRRFKFFAALLAVGKFINIWQQKTPANLTGENFYFSAQDCA